MLYINWVLKSLQNYGKAKEKTRKQTKMDQTHTFFFNTGMEMLEYKYGNRI